LLSPAQSQIAVGMGPSEMIARINSLVLLKPWVEFGRAR
jgi:hypothetical protein